MTPKFRSVTSLSDITCNSPTSSFLKKFLPLLTRSLQINVKAWPVSEFVWITASWTPNQNTRNPFIHHHSEQAPLGNSQMHQCWRNTTLGYPLPLQDAKALPFTSLYVCEHLSTFRSSRSRPRENVCLFAPLSSNASSLIKCVSYLPISAHKLCY